MLELPPEKRRTYYEDVIQGSGLSQEEKDKRLLMIAKNGMPATFREATARGAPVIGVLLGDHHKTWAIDLEKHCYFRESRFLQTGLTPLFLPCVFIPARERRDEERLYGRRFSELHLFGPVDYGLQRMALTRLITPDDTSKMIRVTH